ncbi:Spo11/DNA topoisomerase VI subunit A [Vararia minispora EC-137]|uniref:Spo11/DNA topoisomerase VI subunit A n=1 Tax=Vararia minispora EC-137 TaxID=1314806 RepID=A0ACB8QGJ0_9AGAM|nr:Spo11/DNA topoisomerase VI subunit A [Vararia minispora EC-137]
MHVLNAAHDSLVNDLPTTKRDIYYQDVKLFGSQRGLTDDLAATLGLDRADLNIRASSKGLLCGSGLVIHLKEGGTVAATNSDPILIPHAEDIYHFEVQGNLKWVLVAVFQTLCRLHITDHPSFPAAGVMITGKGYPDIATRQLVATLSRNLPATVPILAFVDGDAFGLDIVSVYKFGSRSLQHEAYKLTASRIECIGLWASELTGYDIEPDAMLPVTAADEKKARAMLQRPLKALPERWRDELHGMLAGRRKAEIEALVSRANVRQASQQTHPLVRYLADKITALVGAAEI